MRVVVCGGRKFRDQKLAYESLDFWHNRLGFTLLIQGGQVSVDPSERHLPWDQRQKWGADYIAKCWAELRGVPMVEEAVSDADWKKFGPRAGPLRNGRMIDAHRPERVISFPGGAGTADMLGQARARGIKCIEIAGS